MILTSSHPLIHSNRQKRHCLINLQNYIVALGIYANALKSTEWKFIISFDTGLVSDLITIYQLVNELVVKFMQAVDRTASLDDYRLMSSDGDQVGITIVPKTITTR